ncbi:hypothetical protein PAUR_a0387 [Pseudoalteromonas aurantia 208]|uniref:Uncharacterized protein n=1 Tax=Pseudoalteromonas aurantia 208 TaxID=1314867 RepID=A0ABR9E8K8_9GAMM|nr:hypothetical protein [Pseudoalteromonas aurantia 208]
MGIRDIVNAFDEWYGSGISPTLVSRMRLSNKLSSGNHAHWIRYILLFT